MGRLPLIISLVALLIGAAGGWFAGSSGFGIEKDTPKDAGAAAETVSDPVAQKRETLNLEEQIDLGQLVVPILKDGVATDFIIVTSALKVRLPAEGGADPIIYVPQARDLILTDFFERAGTGAFDGDMIDLRIIKRGLLTALRDSFHNKPILVEEILFTQFLKQKNGNS